MNLLTYKPYSELSDLLAAHQAACKTCDFILADPVTDQECEIMSELKAIHKAAASTIVAEMDRRAEMIPFCLILKMMK